MPNTIHLHRVFKAPPERVYKAFVTPNALAKWMAPHGYYATVHEMNATVGGVYKMSFTNLSTGKGDSFGGKYLELIPNEKIVHTDAFDKQDNLPGTMTVTTTFKPVLCGTEVRIEQAGLPDAIPVEFCYSGWQESLQLLALLVEAEHPEG
jgi:uncharacterized protein YndB with AHSA1/START domain